MPLGAVPFCGATDPTSLECGAVNCGLTVWFRREWEVGGRATHDSSCPNAVIAGPPIEFASPADARANEKVRPKPVVRSFAGEPRAEISLLSPAAVSRWTRAYLSASARILGDSSQEAIRRLACAASFASGWREW